MIDTAASPFSTKCPALKHLQWQFPGYRVADVCTFLFNEDRKLVKHSLFSRAITWYKIVVDWIFYSCFPVSYVVHKFYLRS